MDRKIIIKEISGLVEIITEQTETLYQYPGQIPQIEIDILLSNIRELYEKYKEFDRFNRPLHSEKTSEKQIPVEKEKTITSQITDEPTQKDIVEFEKTMLVESIAQYSLLSETEAEEKGNETISEAQNSQKKIKQQKKSSPDLFSSESTIADKFKEEKKSLNEKLSDSLEDKTIASKLQKNPIKDLKMAIGINEKFMFVNELFEGSLQKYNENINSLNTMKSKAEAMKFMEMLKNEYSWKKDGDAYIALTDLVSRRYS